MDTSASKESKKNTKNKMALTLDIQADSLRVTVHNNSLKAARIWDRNNSWGWESICFNFKISDSPKQSFKVCPKPRIWTRNGPGFIEIPPGQKQVFSIKLSSDEWEQIDKIHELKQSPLKIQAVLEIPETPEAVEFNVFTGKITSEFLQSLPPHLWLVL